MTEPAALFTRLPTDVAGLNRVVQGLLVHCELLDKYSDDPGAFGPVSRATLPVQQRLAALLEMDGRPLDEVRPPTLRGVGTCRDFALMVCAFLRATGTAARVRCGFAAYFADAWEDHWVCEYWNAAEARWCLSDAQLDDVQRKVFRIVFNTADVPRDVFLTAGEAWLRCRARHDQPERFGQGPTRGIWFLKVNVVRDALAVNNRETSPWDRWREAPPALRVVFDDEIATLDSLARNPGQAVDL
ncbi:MAG TPA: transglutaminase domain-containing protein, partial [Acetobacteraceae bacterium]|nr:transglutaminase domain-containing protein [Acetobacteraceae bacterium]